MMYKSFCANVLRMLLNTSWLYNRMNVLLTLLKECVFISSENIPCYLGAFFKLNYTTFLFDSDVISEDLFSRGTLSKLSSPPQAIHICLDPWTKVLQLLLMDMDTEQINDTDSITCDKGITFSHFALLFSCAETICSIEACSFNSEGYSPVLLRSSARLCVPPSGFT